MGDIDAAAIARGATLAGLIAAPTALAMIAIADSRDGDSSSVVFLFLGIILIGFALGGYRAARDIVETPLTHSALAALLAYSLIQGVGIARRTISGNDISWLALVFNGLLASSFGMVGGFFAQLRNNRREQA